MASWFVQLAAIEIYVIVDVSIAEAAGVAVVFAAVQFAGNA
jgi:hypothetical protein